MMTEAEKYLKDRDIPNEVITVQRDGWIEGNRVSHLMESYHQEQSKWISVDERLPETRPAEECYGHYAMSVDVLVIGEDGQQFTAYYNYTMAGDPMCINPWEECFTECPFGHDYKIEKWMPLPEPPKKD